MTNDDSTPDTPRATAGARRLGLRAAVGAGTLLVLLLFSTLVSVRERHTTLVTRFGRLVRTLDEPGLHFKLPWPLEAEVEVDRRLVVGGTRASEVLTRDQRNVVLESYVAWRVDDPERFYRALGGRERADEVLAELVYDAKRTQVAQVDLSALVSTDAEVLRTDEVEAAILAQVAPTALDQYGVRVEGVGLKRLAFPEANVEAVFKVMRAERQGEAERIRATGDAEADTIRNQTNESVAQQISDAWQQARQIRGEADTEIARRLGELTDLDQELFAFLIRLDSLEQLVTRDTAIYLQTGSGPFELLDGDPAVPRDEDE